MFLIPSGPPGPPGIQSSSSICHLPRQRHYNGFESGECPMSVESQHKLLESGEGTFIEAGTLVFLKKENKMVLKTSEGGWLELQVYL